MKVITLKQPWASLIANGYKKYEFRSWKTNYRGKLYIHAGKGIDKDAIKKFEYLNLEYPKSRIIAKVDLVDCIKLDGNNKKLNENELIYSNNKTGYAWKLDNIEKVNIDKEINGKLSFWEYNE